MAHPFRALEHASYQGACPSNDRYWLRCCRSTTKSEPHELCESCVSGKLTKMSSRIPQERTTKRGHAWHIDLGSASHTTTIGGNTNTMTATDEATGYGFLYYMASRDELPQKLEQHLRMIKAHGFTVAYIRSDNELTNNKSCQQIYRNWEIIRSPSAPYNPHQNGIAERRFRTLFQQIRAILIDSGLPQSL